MAEHRRENDTDQHEHARVETKPTAWQDPRTWMQLISLLLAMVIFVTGYAASKLSSIDTALQMMREDKATKTEQIAEMQKRLDKYDAEQSKKWADQSAYNYDQMKMFTALKAEARQREVKER